MSSLSIDLPITQNSADGYTMIKTIKRMVAQNLKMIIFTGTIEEYGKAKTPFKENIKAKPTSSYGKFKLKSLNCVFPKLICPLFILRTPRKQSKRVDLPHPFGPVKATASP